MRVPTGKTLGSAATVRPSRVCFPEAVCPSAEYAEAVNFSHPLFRSHKPITDAASIAKTLRRLEIIPVGFSRRHKCSSTTYQITLRPSCIRRAVMRVLVIAPNVGLWVFTFALPNCVWFKVLKVSQRNWVFTFSVTRKFLNKLVSQLL